MRCVFQEDYFSHSSKEQAVVDVIFPHPIVPPSTELNRTGPAFFSLSNRDCRGFPRSDTIQF